MSLSTNIDPNNWIRKGVALISQSPNIWIYLITKLLIY